MTSIFCVFASQHFMVSSLFVSQLVAMASSLSQPDRHVEKFAGVLGRLPSDIEILQAPMDNPTGEFVKMQVGNERVIYTFMVGHM